MPRSTGGYGATAARVTPDQKVGSSNLSALKHFSAAASGLGHTTLPGDLAAGPCHTGIAAVFRARAGGSNPPPPTPNLFVVGKPCPQPRRLLPGTINRLPLARAWPPGRSTCCTCQGQRCNLSVANFDKGVWRNGSASDSRSEGWEFESLCPQSMPVLQVARCLACHLRK